MHQTHKLKVRYSLSSHEPTWEPQTPLRPHAFLFLTLLLPLPDEVRKQVRQEFETQKHLDDGYSIKYALSDGRAKLKQLEAMFGMTS